MKIKKGKLIGGAVVLAALVSLFFFAPPVMVSRGGIDLGYYDENFENPYAHLADDALAFENRNVHDTSDFEHFYFLNFKFWEELEIRQAEYAGAKKAAEVKKLLPFLYSVEQNQKNSPHNAFGVRRGDKGWYFDYYTTI